jgi:hypothetical protein
MLMLVCDITGLVPRMSYITAINPPTHLSTWQYQPIISSTAIWHIYHWINWRVWPLFLRICAAYSNRSFRLVHLLCKCATLCLPCCFHHHHHHHHLHHLIIISFRVRHFSRYMAYHPIESSAFYECNSIRSGDMLWALWCHNSQCIVMSQLTVPCLWSQSISKRIVTRTCPFTSP